MSSTMSSTMSPGAQVVYGVRAAAPDSNPFVAIAYTLYQSLYSPMSSFYTNSITALHVLYAVYVLHSLVSERGRTDLFLLQSSSGAHRGACCSCSSQSCGYLGI
jgi:hypothetical protein